MSRRTTQSYMAALTPGYARLYYEAHITVAAPPRGDYDTFVRKVTSEDWRASKFEHDDVDHIEGKWFLSAKAKAGHAIKAMVLGMLHELRSAGFTVERWKIEEAMLDSKYGDPEEALSCSIG